MSSSSRIESLDPRVLFAASLAGESLGKLVGRQVIEADASNYHFTLSQSARVEATIDRIGSGATVSIIDDRNGNGRRDRGETVATATASTAGFVTTHASLPAGAYVVRVDGVAGAFALGLTADLAGPNVATARDLGTLPTGGRVVRDFVSKTDRDVFRLATGNTAGSLRYDVFADAGTTFTLYRDDNADGKLAAGEVVTGYSTSGVADGENIVVQANGAGAYYLRVSSDATKGSNYRLNVAASTKGVEIMGLTASALNGSINVYLKLEGIPGDVTEANHKNWIDVSTLSYGVERIIPAGLYGPQAASRSTAVFSSFSSARSFVDRASVKMISAVATGKVFPTAEYHLTTPLKNGEKNLLELKLSDVLITSFRQSFDKTISETFSTVMRKYEAKFTNYNASGNPIGTVTAFYDQATRTGG